MTYTDKLREALEQVVQAMRDQHYYESDCSGCADNFHNANAVLGTLDALEAPPPSVPKEGSAEVEKALECKTSSCEHSARNSCKEISAAEVRRLRAELEQAHNGYCQDITEIQDERDAARKDLEEAREAAERHMADRDRIMDDLDAARKELENLRSFANDLGNEMAKADSQRDAARTQCAEAVKALERVAQELSVSVKLHAKEARRNETLGGGYPQGPCSCDDCELWRFVRKTIAALPPVSPDKEAKP